MHRRRPSARRGTELGVLLLVWQLAQFGLDRVPPVTLGGIVFMAAVYLGMVPPLDASKTGSLCVQASRVVHGREWMRLIAPAFMHADDMHLYFNMVSLLWKGHRLERRVGSAYFAYVLVVFAVLCNALMVAIAFGLEEQLNVGQYGLMRQCAVGFSGVLFALKVLCNAYYPEGDRRFFGWLPIPSRYASWAELLLIQIMVPNASFVGHLCGILVGTAYVYGPLKRVMDIVWSMFAGFAPSSEQYNDGYRRNARYAGGVRDRGDAYDAGGGGGGGYTQPGYNPHYYTGGLSEAEQLRWATQHGGYASGSGPYPAPRTNYGWQL